jgi:catechol 2,3-dioxygenase-like lactoylglutathione lyase family enzyme
LSFLKKHGPAFQLEQVHPVLPCRDVAASIAFYVDRLGFTLAFHQPDQPAYAGVRRDGVELHMQWHSAEEWARNEGGCMLRFVVADVDALYDELKDQGVFHDRTELRDTAWGTREFAFYDPDRNGLTFYQDR